MPNVTPTGLNYISQFLEQLNEMQANFGLHLSAIGDPIYLDDGNQRLVQIDYVDDSYVVVTVV